MRIFDGVNNYSLSKFIVITKSGIKPTYIEVVLTKDCDTEDNISEVFDRLELVHVPTYKNDSKQIVSAIHLKSIGTFNIYAETDEEVQKIKKLERNLLENTNADICLKIEVTGTPIVDDASINEFVVSFSAKIGQWSVVKRY